MIDHSESFGFDLLVHADELSPAMSVKPEAIIARGRLKVRRRRVSAATAVGTVILIGARWILAPIFHRKPSAGGDGVTVTVGG